MTEELHVLGVGHNERNIKLLAELLEREGYRTTTATTLEEFDQLLEGVDDASAALVDTDGFSAAVWERCEQLRQQNTPFLVLSLNPVDIRSESQQHGARHVLEKPVGQQDLTGLVRHLVEEE